MLSFKSIFITSIYFLFIGSITAQTKIDSLKSELNQKITKEERLTVLNSLTKELVKKNDKNSITYLKDYVELARELKEYDLMAVKSRFIIEHYTNKGKLDSAKYNIGKLNAPKRESILEFLEE